MPFTIQIDPAYFVPGTVIDFQLVDPALRPVHLEIIGADGFVAGTNRITVTDQSTSVTLPANDELPAPPGYPAESTKWKITVHDERGIRFYESAFSKNSPPLDWNELIYSSAPVDPTTSPVLPFYLTTEALVYLPLLTNLELPFYLTNGSIAPIPIMAAP